MDRVVQIFRGAGEPTRLRILLLLRAGELTVTELVQVLGQSQPRVSRHLKLLADCGLVDRVREGSWALYRLGNSAAVKELVDFAAAQSGGEDDVRSRDMARLNAVREGRAARADAYFRSNAAHWDEIRALHGADDAVEACLLHIFAGGPGSQLLDIGTGTGRMLELFSSQVGMACGLDTNMEMLRFARARLSGAGLANCNVQPGDMYALDMPIGGYDVVLLHQVLHFADAPARVLAEAARVLSPGGQLLIIDYAPHEEEMLRSQYAHRRLGFADDEIAGWAKSAGLTIAKAGAFKGTTLEVCVWDARKPKHEPARSQTGSSAAQQEEVAHGAVI